MREVKNRSVKQGRNKTEVIGGEILTVLRYYFFLWMLIFLLLVLNGYRSPQYLSKPEIKLSNGYRRGQGCVGVCPH